MARIGWVISSTAAVLAAGLLAAPPALAQEGLRKLSGLAQQSAGAAQKGLRERGYALVTSDTEGAKTWQYWWHERDNDCVLLGSANGRVQNLVATSETDCNQGLRDPSRLSQSGKVATSAARALGVTELMHKSHQRDLGRYNDTRSVADFERGYRDGLSTQGFRDRGKSAAYGDGYRVGQQKRDAQVNTAARPGTPALGAATAPLGTAAAPLRSANDLVGRRAAELESGMKFLGYTRVTGFSKGKESFSTWRGATASQCMRAVVRTGRIESMSDASESGCL